MNILVSWVYFSLSAMLFNIVRSILLLRIMNSIASFSSRLHHLGFGSLPHFGVLAQCLEELQCCSDSELLRGAHLVGVCGNLRVISGGGGRVLAGRVILHDFVAALLGIWLGEQQGRGEMCRCWLGKILIYVLCFMPIDLNSHPVITEGVSVVGAVLDVKEVVVSYCYCGCNCNCIPAVAVAVLVVPGVWGDRGFVV
ncbi:hypothetical protein GQX74_013376 [Glossina fuscipes]|nr:hypothetical protein GQX74_013376 [Glossina fuscipes]